MKIILQLIKDRVVQVFQAIIAYLLFWAIRFIPIDFASKIGEFVGFKIGPHLPVTNVARKNLIAALPDAAMSEINLIIRGMWGNLGRSLFEFPHLDKINFEKLSGRCEIVGVEHIDALRDDGLPGVFVSGHFANWEVIALGLISRNIPIHLIYRAPNNPLMESLFARRNLGRGELLPKGTKGAKRAIQLLKSGEHLAMLVDQKMNDGIAVPFFGRDAMTAPAVAQFAYRYNSPIVLLRLERVHAVKFRLTAFPPMPLPDTGNETKNIECLMAKINAIMESWIRERPEQWLWAHKRWPN